MRTVKKLTVLLVCAVVSFSFLLSSGCAGAGELTRYQAEFMSLFDTVTIIIGYSESKEDFTLLAGRIKGVLEEYHMLYDIYNDYEGINNIKTINDNAGIAPVKVDGRIIDLLEFALEQYKATDGQLNIAFGSVLSIWHEYRTAGIYDPQDARLPPREQLLAASRHTNIYDMVIDKEASTVYLKDPLMRLDVGAIAKGYATEQTAVFFENEGVTNLLISTGGNVRAIGGKLEGNREIPWIVSIQNPDKSSPEQDIMSVIMNDNSLVSSGGYERYYIVDGTRYHHIIDPETLMPSAYYAAVSIICPDSGMADALSTAIFNMPPEESIELIESIPDTEAVLIFDDGSLRYTSGFEELIYNVH